MESIAAENHKAATGATIEISTKIEANCGSENEPDQMDMTKILNQKMILKCKSCRAYFDSTFSVEEFSQLPGDQNKAGTLHLCPHCGNLSIYELKDYEEPSPDRNRI